MRKASGSFFSSLSCLSSRDCCRIHMFVWCDCCGEELAMAEGALQVQQEKPAVKPKVSCVPKADALWFCYSPVYQMTEYYREGTFDNCRSKWTELFDCLSLKTKPADQIQAILEERERKKPHIWEFRTPEEASKHWKEEFGHLQE